MEKIDNRTFVITLPTEEHFGELYRILLTDFQGKTAETIVTEIDTLQAYMRKKSVDNSQDINK